MLPMIDQGAMARLDKSLLHKKANAHSNKQALARRSHNGAPYRIHAGSRRVFQDLRGACRTVATGLAVAAWKGSRLTVDHHDPRWGSESAPPAIERAERECSNRAPYNRENAGEPIFAFPSYDPNHSGRVLGLGGNHAKCSRLSCRHQSRSHYPSKFDQSERAVKPCRCEAW